MGNVGMGWVMQGWGGVWSCRGAVGHAVHVGVGWGGLITHTVSKIHKWI